MTRIAIREGKTPEPKQALMDEIYDAMRETVAHPTQVAKT